MFEEVDQNVCVSVASDGHGSHLYGILDSLDSRLVDLGFNLRGCVVNDLDSKNERSMSLDTLLHLVVDDLFHSEVLGILHVIDPVGQHHTSFREIDSFEA